MACLGNQLHIITHDMASSAFISFPQHIPQATCFSGMRNIERNRTKVFQWEVGNRLLDFKLRSNNGRKIHRHLLFQHHAIVLSCDTVIGPTLVDKRNQETCIQQNGGGL